MKSLEQLEQQHASIIQQMCDVRDIGALNNAKLKWFLENLTISIRLLCVADTHAALSKAFDSVKKETSNDTTQQSSPPTHP